MTKNSGITTDHMLVGSAITASKIAHAPSKAKPREEYTAAFSPRSWLRRAIEKFPMRRAVAFSPNNRP